ncbi:Xaa-Pro peptidase family protein [Candidatus Saccharibacteria bacterium]|nr:Xaa-Pro peptidase family protein [Candidatus Saccharibacteria bacterium]
MDANFFKINRAKLLEKCNGTPIILSAHTEMQKANDEAFPFTQNANFWYLTGIEAADWRVVITEEKTTLIAPDISKISQIFNGSLSAEEAMKISGADAIITRDEASEFLKNLAKKNGEVWTIFPANQIDFEFILNPSIAKNHAQLKKIFTKVKDLRPALAKLRAIKTKDEIMMMRRAINLTCATFDMVKNELQNYIFEYEAQAKFSYEFERAGAAHAYDPIIASGKSAVTLHYNANRVGLKKDSLVLMDVGARYGNYCADLTRTYAFGEVSQRAKDVHAAVQNAQSEIVDLIKPGGVIKTYMKESDEIIKRALKSLDLMKNDSDFRKYYPHSIGHGLGIDVHDPLGELHNPSGEPATFQPGMVLTVEPGIYIADEEIGVRIEDNILVKEDSIENLSGRLSTDL